MTYEVRIRRYRPDDVDAVFEAVMESKPELSRWSWWCHEAYARQDALTWVEGRPNAWERNEEWSFLIVDSTDRVLGSCGIHRLDLRNGVGELGYWVRSTAICQGVATAATRRLTEWAFDEMGLERIEILVSVENIASQRVAEKSGGIREGILRQRICLHGQRHDCVLFAILKNPGTNAGAGEQRNSVPRSPAPSP